MQVSDTNFLGYPDCVKILKGLIFYFPYIRERTSLPKRYWWILATYILCQLSGLLSFTTLLNFLPAGQRIGILTVTSFLITLIIVLLLLWPEHRFVRDAERADFGEAVKWALIGIFLVYITQIAAAIIEQAIFGTPVQSKNTEKIIRLSTISPYVILVVVIVGPILEEIIFRKIIFGELYKKTNFWIAGIISSLLFALLHADGHIILYGSIGLVLCYLYRKTKRIVVSMVAHGTMNTIAVLVAFQSFGFISDFHTF